MLLCKAMLVAKPGGGGALARIYTRTGDDGTTDLIGKQRVPKDSPFIETIGSLDELNAHFGLVRSHSLPDSVDSALQSVQEQLFVISAEIASPAKTENKSTKIHDADIHKLEELIDTFDSSLAPLQHFILPGGAPAGAHLHLARTVARRAERKCVALSRSIQVDPLILRYLNRLSDLCFVLARYINHQHSIAENFPAIKRS
jgi:cob(I)alamin adenosyltransferase